MNVENSGIGTAGAASGVTMASPDKDASIGKAKLEAGSQKIRAMIRAKLGEEVYTSWFNSLEFEACDGHTLHVSVAVKFLRNWIQSHYIDVVLGCARKEFKTVENIDITVRQPGAAAARNLKIAAAKSAAEASAEPREAVAEPRITPIGSVLAPVGGHTTTMAGGFEGSPIDPRCTFDSFVVGAANRMAHASASQVAETIFSEASGFNPLYIHSAVGLGKTHLLQAIAWEVRRRVPHAQILYLTAEQFRFKFVEALQSKGAMAFKDRFRSIDILLIDDLEFMHGQHTEQEFDHIINAMLDGGKQVVVASARAPNSVDRLSDRMRTRMQRGLVTEISAPDYELRRKIVERRVQEKRQVDPSFEVPREVQELLAERLTENGRELEGATIRLHAHWQYMHTQITVEVAENVIRDLVHGAEPRRVRIEDIIKLVSRHFGVSKPDILSQRRHRSVVWPRQIGMYLSKQLTARSLPEIGRRFGNRDHTTVLHAIRKIEGEITDNPRLRDEIEDLKKLLNS
ncbi:MAG TPA: chromosomal replication initiator protein DnaA [Hyphomicrobiaceae bacterium]|nr:chromosomal replication initiator protein DnaA [Hyphomicrobiaceae bacterium]